MRKSIITPLFIVLTSCMFMGLFSCSDFFETPRSVTFDEDSIFSRLEYAQRLMNQVYSGTPKTINNDWGDRLYGNSPECITDLAAGFMGQEKHSCHRFNLAQLTTEMGSATGWSDALNGGEYMYQWGCIRYAHILLDRVDEIPDATEAQKERIRGECNLILAWHHFEMWRRFGGIPLIKKRLDNAEDQKIQRSTLKDSYDYIIELLDKAIHNPYLPVKSEGVEFGRVNKAFAYALKAKVKLYAASPLFNTGDPYISLGEHNDLICFGQYDISRWKEAADAATEAINFCEQNGYAIVENQATSGDNYLTATTKTPSNGNTEIIQGWQQLMGGIGINQFLPRGTNFSGWHGTVPTHNLVEMYRKTDGSFIDWSSPITTSVNNPTEPFKDLEPRFQISVAHNGSQWIIGNGAYALQYWNSPNGTSGGAESPAVSKAEYSYVTWKYTHGFENIRKVPVNWWFVHVNMRLAELYMIRAEAMNEFSGPSDHVKNDLNKVLNRSGMSVPELAMASPQAMREFIERENAIEFFLEDHRYLDLKRTLRSMAVLNFDAVDARCVKNSNNTYTYTRTVVQHRYFLKKYYLWPFTQNEINKDYGLIQNPGW